MSDVSWPSWAARESKRDHSGRLRYQVADTDQVEGGEGHLGPELVTPDPDVPQLAPAAHRLQPAKDLLHPLADALADAVAGLSGGAVVDGAPAPTGVLGHVRRDPQLPAALPEIPGVVLLVAAPRPPAPVPPRPPHHPE